MSPGDVLYALCKSTQRALKMILQSMCCTYARDTAAGPTSWKALLAGKPEGAPKLHVRPSCGHVPASCHMNHVEKRKGEKGKKREQGRKKDTFTLVS